jgi:lipopolysaccharide export system protein LptA
VARSGKSRGVHRLRAVILVAIALVVASVVALFQLGRAGRPAADPRVSEGEMGGGATAAGPVDEATVLSEGFDYEQQIAGKPVFRLQGDRFTTDRAGKVALQGVRLVLYREGEPYEVSSRTATYDPETRAAELAGDVEVSGGDGWQFYGARLDLVDGGRAIVSRDSRVHFRRGPNLAGSARQLRYDLEGETLELSGRVVVSGREESEDRVASLAAETMTWLRDGSTVVGTGGVRLASGRDRLAAERIDARLREGGDGFESATAAGGVTGSLQNGADGTVDFAAETATVGFDRDTAAPASVLLAAAETLPHGRS